MGSAPHREFVRPVPRPGLIARRLNDGYVVVDPATERAHSLVGVHALVWAAANGADIPELPQAEWQAAISALEALTLISEPADVGRGISRRSLIQRGSLVIAGAGIVSIALPELAAAASTVHASTTYTARSPGPGTLTFPIGSHNISITLAGGSGGNASFNSGAPGNGGTITWSPGITLAAALTITWGGGANTKLGHQASGQTGGAGGFAGGKGGGGALFSSAGGGGGASVLTVSGPASGTLIAGGGGGAGEGTVFRAGSTGGSVAGTGGGSSGGGSGGAGGAVGGTGANGKDGSGGTTAGGGGGAGGNFGGGGSAASPGGGGGAGSSSIANLTLPAAWTAPGYGSTAAAGDGYITISYTSPT